MIAASLWLVLRLKNPDIEEVVSYMTMDKTEIWGIGNTTRRLKKQCLWIYIYVHPENQIVHESQIMHATACLVDPPLLP